MKLLRLMSFLCIILTASACGNQNSSTDKQQSTTKADTATTPASNQKTILFFGDSLTAGYGLDFHPSDAFPGVIQHKIDSLKIAL